MIKTNVHTDTPIDYTRDEDQHANKRLRIIIGSVIGAVVLIAIIIMIIAFVNYRVKNAKALEEAGQYMLAA